MFTLQRHICPFAALAILVFATSAANAQNTIHVPADHASIQGAIDAASSGGGDEIIVAPGTYHEAINFNGKAVHLRSSDGPEATIVDATGSEPVSSPEPAAKGPARSSRTSPSPAVSVRSSTTNAAAAACTTSAHV